MPDDAERGEIACPNCGSARLATAHCPNCGAAPMDSEETVGGKRAAGVFLGLIAGVGLGALLVFLGVSLLGSGPCTPVVVLLAASLIGVIVLAIAGIIVGLRRRFLRYRLGPGRAAFIVTTSIVVFCPFVPCDLLFSLSTFSKCLGR